MCLEIVGSVSCLTREQAKTGYKVFILNKKKLLSAYYYRMKPYKPNVEYRSTSIWLSSDRGHRKKYKSGFHIFENRDGAIELQSNLSTRPQYLESVVIRKVLYWGRVTFGIQHHKATVAAEFMMIID